MSFHHKGTKGTKSGRGQAESGQSLKVKTWQRVMGVDRTLPTPRLTLCPLCLCGENN
jgi:hypothetical protein